MSAQTMGESLFRDDDLDLDAEIRDGMMFYLGAHHADWLGWMHFPLFVSTRTLSPMRHLPRRSGSRLYAIDSGGFTELSKFGEWRTGPTDYLRSLARCDAEIGPMVWAAPQDWMCEPFMLARTGLSVGEHQHRTVDNFLELRARWPEVSDAPCPVMPVLQGWTLRDYEACVGMYEAAGVELDEYGLVGLGSVCRRQATGEIGAIARTFAHLPLHGFGCKTLGLVRYGHLLASADSMAWSYDGRRVQGCTPSHVNEANCPAHAEDWWWRMAIRVGRVEGRSLNEVEDSPLARRRAEREIHGYRGPRPFPAKPRPAAPTLPDLFGVAA